MAEIALVASILGVVDFGTKLTTGLYNAADVMVHAREQIASMAKHVSQFTAVLKHLGNVLKADKGNCSKELLREIRKIKSSLRWLFKKSKAKELEARLESEQSMLQVMVHTLTVSKLGDMQSKSKEGSDQISGLRKEIAFLKNLIIESQNNVTRLQRAEQNIEIDVAPSPHTPLPYAVKDPLSHAYDDPANLDEIVLPRTPSPVLGLSDSENEDTRRDPSNLEGIPTGNRFDEEHATHSDHLNLPSTSAIQPLTAYHSSTDPSKHQVSTLLLQMIPCKSSTTNTLSFNQPRYLASARPRKSIEPDTDSKPAMEEATESVRLLLDKWTNSGSMPVSNILDEIAAKDNEQAKTAGRDKRRGFDDDPFTHGSYPPHDQYERYPYGATNNPMRPPPHHWPPPVAPPYPQPLPRAAREFPSVFRLHSLERHVWADPHIMGQVPARMMGGEVLSALRQAFGGIVYMKGNEFTLQCYVEQTVFYTFHLVPQSLVGSTDPGASFTEIGKSWVRQEALDLLGYTYTETPSGHFSIPSNVDFNNIEELVSLSYQALSRVLENRSKQVIKERGWRDKINGMRDPVYVQPPPWVQDPQMLRRQSFVQDPQMLRRQSFVRYPDPWADELDTTIPGGRDRPETSTANHHYHHRPSEGRSNGSRDSLSPDRSNPSPMTHLPNLRSPTAKDQDAGPGAQSHIASSKSPPISEVRFTVPRMESRPRAAAVPVTQYQQSDNETLHSDLRKAVEKLEALSNKRDLALKDNNVHLASDLSYYAIPEMQARIDQLKKNVENKKKPAAPAEKLSHNVSTKIETDSESSEVPNDDSDDESTS